MKTRGLYIHIPFCARKCAYCDFYSLAGRLDLIDTYLDALSIESQTYAGLSFDTIYLGGGTPSLLRAGGLKKLFGNLQRVFDISNLSEATIEVNPESGTAELFETATALNIKRISIGVQSLEDNELASVGRIHNALQSTETIRVARQSGFREISADVIVGFPGQGWRTLRITLETLIALELDHISLYCLSLGNDTPLAANPPDNLPSDDMQAELFNLANALLEEHGFEHYEISNFALPGHQCQHNLKYWRGDEYLGLGPSAASYLNGLRFKNRDDLDSYLKNPTCLIEDIEELTTEEKVAEEAMLKLRLLREGFSTDGLAGRFGSDDTRNLVKRLDDMVEEGLLINDGSSYRLPPSQVLTSNPIFARALGY